MHTNTCYGEFNLYNKETESLTFTETHNTKNEPNLKL